MCQYEGFPSNITLADNTIEVDNIIVAYLLKCKYWNKNQIVYTCQRKEKKIRVYISLYNITTEVKNSSV